MQSNIIYRPKRWLGSKQMKGKIKQNKTSGKQRGLQFARLSPPGYPN